MFLSRNTSYMKTIPKRKHVHFTCDSNKLRLHSVLQGSVARIPQLGPRGSWTLSIVCCSGRHTNTNLRKLNVSFRFSPENQNKISFRNAVLLSALPETLSIPGVASLEALWETHFRRQHGQVTCTNKIK
jgi:hypothetical protein